MFQISRSSLSNFMPYRSPMNKTLAITTIALVAVVMGMSAVAPMIPQAEAAPAGTCPPGFDPAGV